jgi:uncharacterized protein YcbK (DUF882 family)
MKSQIAKSCLTIHISPDFHNRLKHEIGRGKISEFVERVLKKELDREQKEFQQKLIAGYKSVAKNKKVQKDLEIWDETINDM